MSKASLALAHEGKAAMRNALQVSYARGSSALAIRFNFKSFLDPPYPYWLCCISLEDG
jgi:hypothetical protein